MPNKSKMDLNLAQEQCDYALKKYIGCVNSLVLTDYFYVPTVKVNDAGEHVYMSSQLTIRHK